MAIALVSCVSPEELHRQDEATCTRCGFQAGTDGSASCLRKERAWLGGTGPRSLLRIGGGAIGAGGGIGRDGRFDTVSF